MASEDAKPYLRDIDRMVKQRRRKTSDYLPQLEGMMITLIRTAKVEAARQLFEELCEIYRKLEAWKAAENEKDSDDAAQVNWNGSEQTTDQELPLRLKNGI